MRRTGWLILLLALTGICTGSTPHHAGLKIRNKSVSHRNLSAGASFIWDGGAWQKSEGAGQSAAVQTLKILALRFEFQTDTDIMTTGDGRFMMEAPEEPVINPPPHDKPYFENQLKALAHYYWTVSGGRLILEGEVFPIVMTLPREMGEYNPGTTDERTDQGLAELMRDAVQAADQAGADFAAYDVFMLFHAGVGRDIELGYDPTPKDIPSAFLNASDLVEFLGDAYQHGVPVNNGSGFVPEAIILPETQNQEGFEFGLLGTMTLMFGFQLGLPALWDTDLGRSGVGRWGMMDQGSGNYNGMIPCEPCAFSKVFLGWVQPVEAAYNTPLTVACSAAKSAPLIYKVPINTSEYFLIENRRYDTDFDSVTYATDADGKRILIPSSGFLELESPVNVFVSVDEYDYGLPGSGILIWHIDESVILKNLQSNRINADRSRKGVDLEEADGAQDIGEAYSYLSGGSGAEGGVLHDAWFEDNTIHMRANKSTAAAFTPDSHPNTRSNTGANSHIIIHDFSVSDTLMTFTVRNDLLMKGFPQRFPDHDEFLPPLAGDLDGDGDLEIIIAGSYDNIYAWHHDGSPLFEPTTDNSYTTLSGEEITYPVPAMSLGVFRNRKIDVLGDWDGDGIDEYFISGDRNGEVGIHIFHGILDGDGLVHREGFIPFATEDQPVNMSLDVSGQRLAVISYQGYFRVFTPALTAQVSVQLSHSGLSGLCMRPENRWAVTGDPASGDIYLLDGQGRIEWQTVQKGAGSPSACSVEGYGELIWLHGEDDGYLLNPSVRSITALNSGSGVLSPDMSMALADIDRDGFPEACRSAAGGQLFAFDHYGTVSHDFPAPYDAREISAHQPLIADIDGDGEVELLISTSDGTIEVYSSSGQLMSDWVFSTGSPSRISIADVDLDGDMELMACASTGMLFIWDLEAPYTPESVPWGYSTHDPGRSGLAAGVFTPEPVVTRDWMPAHLAYNYPNPNEENHTTIRYRLERSADVEITIYDLSGEKIDRFPGPGAGQAENEARWDLTSVASGIYICHIKASGSEGSREATFKIGVVK